MLEALPKIIEKFFYGAFQQRIEEDYKENGDPCQMAYEPNRSCTSCNLISLTVTEAYVLNGLSCAQYIIDNQKAFNKASRSIAVNEVQRITGYGKLIRSWFLNRTYVYKGEVKPFIANRGGPPGTVFSPMTFKLVIIRI